MAEKGCGSRDAAPPIARRSSFRKTLREIEGSLPAEYLEALESKRKQLDESIHKYIASKEREYKNYERDLKQQAKSQGAAAAASQARADGNASSSSASRRRTSSESMQDAPAGSPTVPGQQRGAVDALLASGTRRDRAAQGNEEDHFERRSDMVGLTDRRDSELREKEFVGLFTPPYLPAIDDKPGRGLERTESAPAAVGTSSVERTVDGAESLPRADSDSSVQAKAKRPAHLQLSHRTSSSGSSADGKLASAMKSPIHSAQRPKRKRVSLAVGDSIVAPSDNVPSALSRSSTPSHSRTLSPESEREHVVPTVPTGPTTSLDFAKQPVPKLSNNSVTNGSSAASAVAGKSSPQPERTPAAPASARPSPKSPSSIDPDGDLFDLEEEAHGIARPSADDVGSAVESEEDATPGIAGRIEHGTDRSQRSEAPSDPAGPSADEKYDYDPEAGLIPESSTPTQPVFDSADKKAENLSFDPGSAGFSSSSSKQPTNPGFRRPSVSADPIFRGPAGEYKLAESQAVTEEIYGSSYVRPTGKGSFTAGSLGESYMARHAEEMMKLRGAKREEVVR